MLTRSRKLKMESSGEPSFALMPDWDQPITDAELNEIEAAFTHATTSSSIKQRRSFSPEAIEVRSKARRLPRSLGRCHQNPSVDRSEEESCPIADVDSFVPRIGQWNPVYSPYPRKGFDQVHISNGSAPPISHIAKAKAKYPKMNFGGRINYSRTLLEVEKATMELLEFVETKKKTVNPVPLGFDIEWRPIFKRGCAQRKAAVIQICGDNGVCYVMHIIHSGIPPILQTLLEDSSSLKVGICIANDAKKIFNDYNVRVKPLEDLSSLANSKGGALSGQWSLSSLTEMLTSKELEKPNKIRLGNWEAHVLSEEKLQYAATDAFVSWYLYQVLQNIPDASETKSS